MQTSARLLKLLALLQEGSGLPAQALAVRCGVSQRTIRRDLSALLRLGYPIRFDGGYQLAAPELLPPVQFSPEEALAARLALADKGEAAAKAAATKLAALPATARVAPASRADPQLPLDLPSVANEAESAWLASLHAAVAERRRVQITEARGRRPARQYALEPYRILFGRGRWWVVGFAPARGRLIALAADRVRAVVLMRRRFREREGVRLGRFLGRLGSNPPPPSTATLRLAPSAVPLAAGLPAAWLKHLTTAPDGSAHLALATPHSEQLLAWVLLLGEGAEVLEPPALRAELARRGRALAQRYGGGGPP